VRSPRGPLGLALAVFSCLLFACGRGSVDPAPDNDRASDKKRGQLDWGPVERLAGSWAAYSATVLSADGTATVVWGGPRSGMSRQAPAGEPWGAATPIPHSKMASMYIAGADADGTVTAVWDSDDSYTTGTYSIWSATLPSGGAWSPAVKVATDPYEDIGLVDWDLAVGPSGDAVLSWVDEDQSMQVAHRPAGAEWSEPTSMKNSWTTLSAPVTIDAEGLATVAYLRGNAGLLTLAQGSEKGWAEPIELNEPLGLRPYDIAAAGDGEVAVAWQQKDLTFVTGRLVDGAVSEQQPLTDVRERTVEMVVSGADDGSARFVWRTAGDETEVRSVSQSSSGEIGDLEIIGKTSRCPPAEAPPVSLDSNGRGHAILAWSGTHPSGLNVAHLTAEDNGWAPQEVVTRGHGPGCENASTASLSEAGSALVTWVDSGSDPYGMGRALLARRGTLE